jgi:hypothetical protein
VTETRQQAQQIKASRPAHAVARIGLGSRAVVYFALAFLILELAFGRTNDETDQGGAFRGLRRTTPGTIVLVLLVIGIACYVTWRWSEAILGAAGEQHQKRARLMAVLEGAGYLPFGVMAVAVLFGDPQQSEQSSHYRTASARALSWPGGQWLVGAVGLVIIGVGIFLISQGLRTSFEDQLDFGTTDSRWRTATLTLGVIGSLARGAIFALSGIFVVVAAATVDPSDAGGLDTALHSLSHDPWGQLLLVVAAAGFAAFALFALAEAKWRIT